MPKIYRMKGPMPFAVLIVCTMLSSGCSVVGLGVGMAIDNSHTKLSECGCGYIKAETKATVCLHDGSTVDGEFRGLEYKPEREYIDVYNDFREKNRSRTYLPAIGDTLIIAMVDGNRGLHRFEGFDYIRGLTSIEQMEHGRISSCVCISARELRSREKREFALSNLFSVSGPDGQSVTGEVFRSLCSSTVFPLQSELSLISDGQPRHIDLDKIESIKVYEKRYAKWIGLGIGLVIDAAIIAIGVSLSESMSELGS